MADARLPLTDAPTHGDRTHTCGALRESDAGQTVVLKGWVDQRRNFGGLNFIDLRDRYGLTQLVFSPELNAELADLAERLRGEDVISAKGEVRVRERKNPEMATGDVEVYVTDVEVLALSATPPFVVSENDPKATKPGEDLALKYRYLALRRSQLQRNMMLRSDLYQSARSYFHANDFVEVERPVLMKSTPDGARDYLVPSRSRRARRRTSRS